MRNFSARETEWLQELDGIELAGFWRRAFAFLLDWIFVGILLTSMLALVLGAFYGVYVLQGRSNTFVKRTVSATDSKDVNLTIGPTFMLDSKGKEKTELQKFINDSTNILVAVLYFGILLWKGKGRTPGKRIMKIRVVSLVHRHLSFWHSVERALGYAAAGLEAGFGFIQYFIHPYRRCVQDRIAETIVVTERSYQALQHRLAHPLIPDSATNPPDLLPSEEPTAR